MHSLTSFWDWSVILASLGICDVWFHTINRWTLATYPDSFLTTSVFPLSAADTNNATILYSHIYSINYVCHYLLQGSSCNFYWILPISKCLATWYLCQSLTLVQFVNSHFCYSYKVFYPFYSCNSGPLSSNTISTAVNPMIYLSSALLYCSTFSFFKFYIHTLNRYLIRVIMLTIYVIIYL